MNHRRIIFLIAILAFVLRIFQISQAPLSGDESINAVRSYWLWQGIVHLSLRDLYGLIVHTHSPAELLLPLPFIASRFSEFTIRLATVLIGTLIPLAFLWLFHEIFNRRLLFLGSLILAVSPFLIGWSRINSFPATDMLVSLFLVHSLYQLWQKPIRKNLLILTAVYALSLLVMMDFILLLPLVFASVFLLRRSFLKADVLKAMAIFICITGGFFLPYILFGLALSPSTLGINHNLGRNFHAQPWNNFLYFLTSYFFHPSVWLLFVPFISSLLFRGIRQSRFMHIISIYIFSYLIFYILIYGKAQAYLYGIYIPIFLGGLFVLQKTKMLSSTVIGLIAVVFLIITYRFFLNQSTGSSAILGFGRATNLAQAAYLVRKCTLPSEKVISDLDGYQVSLYFDRHYFSEQDKVGLGVTIQKYSPQAGAIYVNGKLHLRNCSLEDLPENGKKFYQEYWDKGEVISFYR